ncbi:MAG: carbohydrate porin [Planctomycetes bacterium]|nr:carbohydrate porin [Planctomycetota bacterium]
MLKFAASISLIALSAPLVGQDVIAPEAESGILHNFGLTQSFHWLNGGSGQDSAATTQFDYDLTLDLELMNWVQGASVHMRAQSRFGSNINAAATTLLPVDSYSAYPFDAAGDDDIGIAITELYWVQLVSDELGWFGGKLSTMANTNEFAGGEGRSQFMNFQFIYPAVVAQLAPYSTLAFGGFWIVNPNFSIATTLMNQADSATTSGFSDIGDGVSWTTSADYRSEMNDLPGGGNFAFSYGINDGLGSFGGRRRGHGLMAGSGAGSAPNSWAATWSGWQYLDTESGTEVLIPANGYQDLQGIGVFALMGLADDETNSASMSVAGGLSGRGTMDSRDFDTWGVGYFHTNQEDQNVSGVTLEPSSSGIEAYYDIALTSNLYLTLDAQWLQSAIANTDDVSLFGIRLRVDF